MALEDAPGFRRGHFAPSHAVAIRPSTSIDLDASLVVHERACDRLDPCSIGTDVVTDLRHGLRGTFTREAGNISRMQIGRYLVEKHEARVKQKVERAYRFTSCRGTRVLVFEGLSYASDAAELVGQDADLVVGFSFDSRGTDQVLNFSTRSHTTFDCAAFCAANSGGGHKFAAGFDVVFMPETASNPFAILRILLDDWEF